MLLNLYTTKLASYGHLSLKASVMSHALVKHYCAIQYMFCTLIMKCYHILNVESTIKYILFTFNVYGWLQKCQRQIGENLANPTSR